MTSQVQEKYLSLCQLFIVKVVPTLCRDVIESVVKNVTKDVDLSQTMSAGDVEKYLTEMADLADRVCIEGKKGDIHTRDLEHLKIDF